MLNGIFIYKWPVSSAGLCKHCEKKNNPAFKAQIETAFFLKNSQDAHVLNFGHFQPDDFFNKPDGESSDNSNQATLMGNNDEAFDLSCWLN